jgi:hypothetical protein
MASSVRTCGVPRQTVADLVPGQMLSFVHDCERSTLEVDDLLKPPFLHVDVGDSGKPAAAMPLFACSLGGDSSIKVVDDLTNGMMRLAGFPIVETPEDLQ